MEAAGSLRLDEQRNHIRMRGTDAIFKLLDLRLNGRGCQAVVEFEAERGHDLIGRKVDRDDAIDAANAGIGAGKALDRILDLGQGRLANQQGPMKEGGSLLRRKASR